VSINSIRYYFDYNSSTPLRSSVQSFLGDSSFLANPSSIHQEGRETRKRISQTRKFLFSFFKVDSSVYQLVFHSGATEGINGLFRSAAISGHGEKILYSLADHPVVRECAHLYFSHAEKYDLLQSGDIVESDLAQKLVQASFLNITHSNNETGVIHSLKICDFIRAHNAQLLIHLDMSQSVGRVPREELDLSTVPFDLATFSGHKFGALKGIGFSFVRKSLQLAPISVGGGQEAKFRSGTENVHGILSLEYALKELDDNPEQRAAKLLLEKSLENLLGNKGEIVGRHAKLRNDNTIYFLLYHQKADVLVSAFDMDGMSVSSGSACSAGALQDSEVLLSYGYDRTLARSGIRLSFEFDSLTQKKAEEYFAKISSTLKRFL